jgi:hypothetical protein
VLFCARNLRSTQPSVALPTAALIAVHSCLSQLIQQLMFHLLEVIRLWKLGNPSLAALLKSHADSLYTCFRLTSRLLGQSEVWPKLHELLHVAQDVAWFGAADGYDTGS